MADVLTLSPDQITALVAEDASRGLLPKIVKSFASSGEMYKNVCENPAIVAKYDDMGKLKNALAQAIKNASDKTKLAGGSFPELSAVRATLGEGTPEVVLIVNNEILAASQKNGSK